MPALSIFHETHTYIHVILTLTLQDGGAKANAGTNNNSSSGAKGALSTPSADTAMANYTYGCVEEMLTTVAMLSCLSDGVSNYFVCLSVLI